MTELTGSYSIKTPTLNMNNNDNVKLHLAFAVCFRVKLSPLKILNMQVRLIDTLQSMCECDCDWLSALW